MSPMPENPEHFPIPVDAAGNGPASEDDTVALMCWCETPGCTIGPDRWRQAMGNPQAFTITPDGTLVPLDPEG